jgi:hypothetical protein
MSLTLNLVSSFEKAAIKASRSYLDSASCPTFRSTTF